MCLKPECFSTAHSLIKDCYSFIKQYITDPSIVAVLHYHTVTSYLKCKSFHLTSLSPPQRFPTFQYFLWGTPNKNTKIQKNSQNVCKLGSLCRGDSHLRMLGFPLILIVHYFGLVNQAATTNVWPKSQSVILECCNNSTFTLRMNCLTRDVWATGFDLFCFEHFFS